MSNCPSISPGCLGGERQGKRWTLSEETTLVNTLVSWNVFLTPCAQFLPWVHTSQTTRVEWRNFLSTQRIQTSMLDVPGALGPPCCSPVVTTNVWLTTANLGINAWPIRNPDWPLHGQRRSLQMHSLIITVDIMLSGHRPGDFHGKQCCYSTSAREWLPLLYSPIWSGCWDWQV